MQSKTSFFSPIIFKKNLSRFYLLAILYTVAVCLILPLVVNLTIMDYNYILESHEIATGRTKIDVLTEESVRAIYNSTVYMAILSFFGAVSSAMAVFGYLYRSNNSNMIASLPIRREAVFLSSIASIYVVVIAANALACIITLALTIPQGLMLGGWIMDWFFISLMQFTTFFGIASFCAVITGSIVAMPLIYGTINCVVFTLVSALTGAMSIIMFGVQVNSPDWAYYLSPPFFIFEDVRAFEVIFKPNPHNEINSIFEDAVYKSWGPMWAYTGVGIAFMAISTVLIRKRHMETAGDVISFKFLKPVFKVLFTLSAAIIGGMMIYGMFFSYSNVSSYISIMLCFAICAFIGYVLSEMIVKKRSKINVKKTMPLALASAVLAGGFITAVEFDLFGAEKYVPQESEVQSVEFGAGGSSKWVMWVKGEDDPAVLTEVLNLHQTIIDKREYHDYQNESGYRDGHPEYYYLTYFMENGDEVTRRYDVYDVMGADTGFTELRELINGEFAMAERLSPKFEVNLETIAHAEIQYDTIVEGASFNEEEYMEEYRGEPYPASTSTEVIALKPFEAYELYTECIIPDMLDGNIGQVDLGFWQDNEDFEFYSTDIIFEFRKEVPAGTEGAHNYSNEIYFLEEYFTVRVTENSERTIEWLTEKGVQLVYADRDMYLD